MKSGVILIFLNMTYASLHQMQSTAIYHNVKNNGDINMLWDLFQQLQISSSQQSASAADLKASIAQTDIQQLEGQVQTLALACQAMWEILAKQYGVSEIDLLNKMSEIDLRDGVMDGKLVYKASTKCPDCGKEVKKVRSNCYWCGTKLIQSTPFIK